MRLAVVAYPSLDEADRRWIEAFRGKHDPQAFRIDVHFTIVFPVEMSEEELGSEVAMAARSIGPIAFLIRRTAVAPDFDGRRSHVFLVPDEGDARVIALHDHLYSGTLRPHLRADIPFVPHMTVGAAPDPASALRLADELDVRSRPVRGTLEALALVDVETTRVRSIATYSLSGR